MDRPPTLPRLAGPLARAWPLLAALAVAAVGFQLVFGLRLLGAGDAYWSNPDGDMGQMLAGELAGLRAPWSLPLLTPDTLLAPDRVSLVYTDSIPWLTALLKLLHLGRTFSLLGTFLLLSWLAQPAAMYALLRACGVRRASTLLAGMLLALLVPAWLGRQIGHIALSGHALQIAALALAVRSIRGGLDRAGLAGFFALAVAAVGVHAYHAPIITLMFAAALASDLLQRRPGGVRRLLAAGPTFLVVLLATAWVSGYFVGRGSSGGVAALGFYEMNIVSPLLPQGSALAGQKWTGGWFTHSFDPTGGQVFEGYNYLGAGLLLLLVVAAPLLWRERRRAAVVIDWRANAAEEASPVVEGRSWFRRWGPLATCLGLLTLYAVGTKPYLGTLHLLTVPLPDQPWMEPLALFRCHGRFFWLVGYALLAGALTVLDRSSPERLRQVALTAAVVLQAADMSQMLLGLHDFFSLPEPLRVPSTLAGPAFRGRDVRIYPGYFCTGSVLNHVVVRQLSLIAQRQGGSTNSAETARAPAQGCAVAPPPGALTDAASNDQRITVLMSEDGQPSATTNLFARRSDCASIGSYWMCGQGVQRLPGATAVSGRSLADTTRTYSVLALGTADFATALGVGWSKPEASGVWSVGPRALLRLPHPETSPGGVLRVSLNALGYQPPGRSAQRAFVSVLGRRLAEWRLDGGGYHGLQVAVPAELLSRGQPLEIVIDLPDALSPNDVLPGSGDPRKLGIGLSKITLAQ